MESTEEKKEEEKKKDEVLTAENKADSQTPTQKSGEETGETWHLNIISLETAEKSDNVQRENALT